MNSPGAKKKLGRPKGSKNKPKNDEEENNGNDDQNICPDLETILDSNDNKDNTIQWQNAAKKSEQTMRMALAGFKKLREMLNVAIMAAERANTPAQWFDAMTATKSIPQLIFCDDKTGWMDIGYCNFNCNNKCYKFNSKRWICTILHCTREKITACDDKDDVCQAANILRGFADRYFIIHNILINEGKIGNYNKLSDTFNSMSKRRNKSISDNS
jgi:hypothetical protein